MGQTLVNHSYVDLSTVGYSSDGSNSVQCHTHVVVVVRVLIVETGISLMERDCHCLVRCYMSAVDLRELTYVELVVMDQLVSIAVIFQLMLSMMMVMHISQ